MNTVESLSTKQKQLIGIGAAVAAGCEPCTTSFVSAAQAAGACERGVRFSLEGGLAARESATSTMSAFVYTSFAHPELDASFREERALIGALIGVAAALAGNTAAVMEARVEAARALGATDAQLRVAAQLGRTAKRGAEAAVEAAFAALFAGEPDSTGRCAGDDSSGGCAPAPVGPCACGEPVKAEFETVHIEKTKASCSLCEDYARAQAHKPVVVMSCEGACLRGEISRQAANHLCSSLAPEKTVRLCLGGAFTKEGGQRDLVRNAARVVALEGCSIRCASRMMRGHLPNLNPEVVLTDGLCEFDRSLFGIEALSPDEVKELGRQVAGKVAARL